MNNLNEYLNKIIKNYSETVSKSADDKKHNDNINLLIDECNDLSKDLSYASKFIENGYSEMLETIISPELFFRLNFNIERINANSFPTTLENLASITSLVIKDLKNRLISDILDTQGLVQILKRVKEIKLIIDQNLELSNSDFVFLSNIIKDDENIDIEEKKDLVISLGKYLLENKSYRINQDEFIEENNYEIDDEVLKKLFDKYDPTGLMSSEVNKIKGEMPFSNLKKFGKTSNIEKILNILSSNHITFKYLKEYLPQLIEILYRSNPEIVTTIINFLKEDISKDMETNNSIIKNKYKGTDREILAMIFANECLSCTSLFIHNKQFTKRKRKPVSSEHELTTPVLTPPTDYIQGAFDNYVANRKFLTNLGIPIKINSFSILGKSHLNIREKYEYLLKYGITPEIYQDSLTALLASDIDKKMDIITELNLIDYIRQSPSFLHNGKKLAMLRIKYVLANGGSLEKDVYGRLGSSSIKKYITSPKALFVNEKGGPEDKEPFNTAMSEVELAATYERVLELVDDNKLKKDLNLSYLKEEETNYSVVSREPFSEYGEYTYKKQFLLSRIIRFDDTFRQEDDLTYKINGITISRYKVLKNLSSLIVPLLRLEEIDDIVFDQFKNILIYSLVKGSFITPSELDILKEEIKMYNDGIVHNRSL